MPSALLHAPDVTAFAADVVVFLAAIAAVVAGTFTAIKSIKKSVKDMMDKEPDETTGGSITRTQVLGGMLQDLYAQKAFDEAMTSLKDSVIEGNEKSRDLLCDIHRELKEMRHTIERAIDRSDRR